VAVQTQLAIGRTGQQRGEAHRGEEISREFVATAIEGFEEAFITQIVMRDNRTGYEQPTPRIAQIIESGEMQGPNGVPDRRIALNVIKQDRAD
jgi:hypothetical protein